MTLSVRARLSQYWLPTRRDDPAEASIVSHKLMLRAGMVRQSVAGIYVWLPLGLRVLKKISNYVAAEMNLAGASELLMPTIQSADLWKSSGRYDAYGPEMLRITDRHDRALLYGPTNEEVITKAIGDEINSYRQLPLLLYHIQWKFRDEIRPRFGVLRGREFLMKDAYSFDIDEEAGLKSYRKMFLSYLRVFKKMGLTAIPMLAETGPIGGDNSHEFIVISENGESKVYLDSEILKLDPAASKYSYDGDLKNLIEDWTSFYAATEDKIDQSTFNKIPAERRLEKRGIEVGQTFFFGDKYSKPLAAKTFDVNGKEQFLMMGSYGIGISRLVGAIIETSNDKNGIVWPAAVAPFEVGVIPLSDSDAVMSLAKEAGRIAEKNGCDWLIDDRKERAGIKFSDMDLIGVPWQIIVGEKSAATGKVELKIRSTGKVTQLKIADLQDAIIEAKENA